MDGESVALRIRTLRLLRRLARTKPEYAFDKAMAFWEDMHVGVSSELLGLVADLIPPYFEESLPLIRRHLSMTASQPAEFKGDVSVALGVLAKGLNHYPEFAFEEAAAFVRQYFGDNDLELAFGQYPLDTAFKIFAEYLLLSPETNLQKVITLLEERFKVWWQRTMKPEVPYDGMKHMSLMTGTANFGSPTLHEDAMVNVCLTSPLLILAKANAQSALKLAGELATNVNAFARRAALHVALNLYLEGNTQGEALTERVVDSYLETHEYLSVFQTAESFLIPLATKRPSYAMHLINKLAAKSLGYLDEFEIGALLVLRKNNDHATELLLQIVKDGRDFRVPQVIKGTENAASTHPDFTEQVLRLAVERFKSSSDIHVIRTVTEATTALAKVSWSRAKPVIEMVVNLPDWSKSSNIEQSLADIAKENPDARADVKILLEQLSHSPVTTVRESVVSAVAKLSDTEGDFGLKLLEMLAQDPSPAPEEDSELLNGRVGGPVVIRTVRGAVASFAPHFIRVDEKRCWDLLRGLSADSSAYVRMMAMHSIEPYARARQYMTDVMKLLISGGPETKGLFNDKSPSVRHMALRLAFYQLVGNPAAMDLLYTPMKNALGDSSGEVREEAAERVLDAVARGRDARYLQLLNTLVTVGTSEQRSAVAFRIRSYMEEDKDSAFQFFKPLLTTLISDQEHEVREKAILSLEGWADKHPQEVAQWCCQLAEAESKSYQGPFTSGIGYHIRLAFSQLVAKHPTEALTVLDCIQKYPDKYDQNNIVSESKALSLGVREKARPTLENLLRNGVPSAQDVLDSWDKETRDNSLSG